MDRVQRSDFKGRQFSDGNAPALWAAREREGQLCRTVVGDEKPPRAQPAVEDEKLPGGEELPLQEQGAPTQVGVQERAPQPVSCNSYQRPSQ